MDPENSQGPKESKWDRLRRAPAVLRSYANGIEKHGKPLDNGCPSIMRFVADMLDEQGANGEDAVKR